MIEIWLWNDFDICTYVGIKTWFKGCLCKFVAKGEWTQWHKFWANLKGFSNGGNPAHGEIISWFSPFFPGNIWNKQVQKGILSTTTYQEQYPGFFLQLFLKKSHNQSFLAKYIVRIH